MKEGIPKKNKRNYRTRLVNQIEDLKEAENDDKFRNRFIENKLKFQKKLLFTEKRLVVFCQVVLPEDIECQ